MAGFYFIVGVALSFIASSEDFNRLCGQSWETVLKSKFYDGETKCTSCNKLTIAKIPDQATMMITMDMLGKPISIPGYSEPMVMKLMNGHYRLPTQQQQAQQLSHNLYINNWAKLP